MTDMELFKCFNIVIGKNNNHLLLVIRPTATEPPSQQANRIEQQRRVKRLKRFYNRYRELEISPFDPYYQVNK